jgi:hypothetical protein
MVEVWRRGAVLKVRGENKAAWDLGQEGDEIGAVVESSRFKLNGPADLAMVEGRQMLINWDAARVVVQAARR